MTLKRHCDFRYSTNGNDCQETNNLIDVEYRGEKDYYKFCKKHHRYLRRINGVGIVV